MLSSTRAQNMGLVELDKMRHFHFSNAHEANRLLKSIESEVKIHSQWLYEAKESLKRKIYDSAGPQINPCQKKMKVTMEDDIENFDPNRMSTESMGNVKKTNEAKQLDVTVLKVLELREELRARGLETKGLKKDLQRRLKSALTQEEKLPHENNDKSNNDKSNRIAQTCRLSGGESDMKNESTDTSNDWVEVQEQVVKTTESENVLNTHPDTRLNSSMDIDMEHHKIGSIGLKLTKSNVPETITISSTACNSSVPDSTKKKIEVSIEDLNKLQVDSSKKEKKEDKNQETRESIDIQSLDTPSSAKRGTVQKLMEATSKLFTPSKKKDTTPSKLSPSFFKKTKSSKKSERDELKNGKKEVTPKIPVTEMASRWESGDFQGSSAKKTPQKTQVPLNVSSSSKAQKTTYDLSNSHSKEIQHNSEITSDMSKIPGSDSDRSCPSTGNSTNTSQRLQQKKEQIAAARKARLEEMRDKSKALAKAKEISMSASKMPHTMKSSFKPALSVTNHQSQSTENKRIKMQIKEKMRQKAAAEALKKAPTVSSATKSTSGKLFHKNSSNDIRPTPQRLAAPQQKVLSPMDTYEISDREDTDSESESESDEDKSPSPKKRVPKWARSVNLNPALIKQFTDSNRLDPELLFSEIQTCNLEEIFNQKRARYAQRTSSGNWTKDRVTVMEKLVYKRQMGFSGSDKK